MAPAPRLEPAAAGALLAGSAPPPPGPALEAGVVEQLVGGLDAVGDVIVMDLRRVEADGREVRVDRARGGLAPPEPHVLDDGLAAHGIGDGLADFQVVEGRLAGVEVELD